MGRARVCEANGAVGSSGYSTSPSAKRAHGPGTLPTLFNPKGACCSTGGSGASVNSTLHQSIMTLCGSLMNVLLYSLGRRYLLVCMSTRKIFAPVSGGQVA